jgi:hypothetical protein
MQNSKMLYKKATPKVRKKNDLKKTQKIVLIMAMITMTLMLMVSRLMIIIMMKMITMIVMMPIIMIIIMILSTMT